MELSKETKERIEAAALKMYSPMGKGYLPYIAGATAEALRSQKLVRSLEMIRDGFDHENDAHKYNNLNACPVCIATEALTQYNQQP
jgi:hypothetical protein